MTKQEYAKKKAEELRKLPTNRTVIAVINEILRLQVNGKPITESVANEIVELIGEEVGSLRLISEQFDNKEQISVMQQMHKLMDQANKEKSQNDSGKK